jgi:sterol 3beta-glucosyltransferase
MPFVANRPRESATRLSPRTFAMLTIGSRGDVQPYIALGLRLKKDGHTIVIITHDEFKGWIEGYGLIHRQAGGDPTALMKLSQEHAVSYHQSLRRVTLISDVLAWILQRVFGIIP